MSEESGERERMGGQSRSILITGCSSGIGAAAAEMLAARGWRVFASCRKEEDCARWRDRGIAAPRLDYADEPSIEAAFAEVMAETGGRLDALYNNGAYAIPGALEDLPTDGLRAAFETNLFGWHALTNLAVPVMRAQGAGRIVNCSSVLGFSALKYRGAYQATKFALEGLTDTLRLELHGTGVHVSLIEPGPITSRFRENSYAHFKRWIRVEGSPHAAIYANVDKRLKSTAKSRFELGPEAVVEKLIHALESDRPRVRYFVTTPTYISNLAKRVLSSRCFDRLALRQSD